MRGESSYGMICGAEEVYLENIFPAKNETEIDDKEYAIIDAIVHPEKIDISYYKDMKNNELLNKILELQADNKIAFMNIDGLNSIDITDFLDKIWYNLISKKEALVQAYIYKFLYWRFL